MHTYYFVSEGWDCFLIQWMIRCRCRVFCITRLHWHILNIFETCRMHIHDLCRVTRLACLECLSHLLMTFGTARHHFWLLEVVRPQKFKSSSRLALFKEGIKLTWHYLWTGLVDASLGMVSIDWMCYLVHLQCVCLFVYTHVETNCVLCPLEVCECEQIVWLWITFLWRFTLTYAHWRFI